MEHKSTLSRGWGSDPRQEQKRGKALLHRLPYPPVPRHRLGFFFITIARGWAPHTQQLSLFCLYFLVYALTKSMERKWKIHVSALPTLMPSLSLATTETSNE
jgi:hypothetical protein